LLLPEQALGAQPSPRNLVGRDRQQIGLAVAVVLFESPIDGGAMHTARFARDQGRLVAVPVPSPDFAGLASCTGNQVLIDNGV
jgi:DNA processing protein